MFVNQLFNAIFQILIFSVIPFIWWLITTRKKENFFSWIGLKKPVCEKKGRGILIIIVSFAIIFIAGQLAIFFRGDLEAADSAYKGMGMKAIPSIMIYAFGQTAFSEEIVFRGFLLKRLMSKFGLWRANLISAALFGVIHLFMVWGHVNLLAGTLIVVYPAIVALLLGYINEQKFKGSIIPSWIIHGAVNTVEGILQAL